MSGLMAFFVFLNAWWVALFVALPLGIEKTGETGALDYAAAPRRIRWKKIFIINTLLAAALTALLALVIDSGIVQVK